MPDLAPAPKTIHHLSGRVHGGPLTVTLTGAHRAVVTAVRAHVNDTTPTLKIDGTQHEYRIDSVVLHRQDSGAWRAESTATIIVRPCDPGLPRANAAERKVILEALEALLAQVATPGALWVAARNALYRAQHEGYLALQANPDDSDVRANYNRLGAEIDRHLTLSAREV